MKLPLFSGRRNLKLAITVITAALLIGLISYIGLRNNRPGDALTAGQAALSMRPSTGGYAPGATIPVEVRVNSSAPVTVVRSVIEYPANLQFVGVQGSSIFTTTMREKNVGNTLDVIRGVAGGNAGVSGDNLVFTVTFKVIGTTGSVPLSFTNSSEAYDNSGSGTNILSTAESAGALYSIGSSASLSSSTDLFRMANWKTQERLFTTSWEEVVAAQKNGSGWVYENVAMRVYTTGGTGRTTVYRMANWKTKERLFTTSFTEVQYAIRNYEGWIDEGVGFYASADSSNRAVYRMANWKTRERLFTTDANERDAIRDKNGWVYEGVAFYAAP